MMRLLSFLALLAVAKAFTSPQPWGTKSAASTAPRFMFSTDEGTESQKTEKVAVPEAKPLKSVDEPVETATPKPATTSIVKDMNTGEVKEVQWVDPAMHANTNPWQMSWYAQKTDRVSRYLFMLECS